MKVLPLSCIFAYTNLITHEFLYSSSSLLNESLLHDKLWGPSQRVVTLLISEILELTTYLDQNHKDAEQGQFILALNKVKCNFVCKFSTNSIVKVHFPLKM